jgi:hypothetical protein
MNRLTIAFAALLLAGCASGSTGTSGQAAEEAPNTTSDTAPAQEAPDTSSDVADEEPEPVESTYDASTDDWEVKLKVTEKDCFGSAGCLVTVEPKVTYVGYGEAPEVGTLDITFEISGDEDGEKIETVTIDLTDGMYSFSPITVSTPSESTKPRAKVSEVEWEDF